MSICSLFALIAAANFYFLLSFRIVKVGYHTSRDRENSDDTEPSNRARSQLNHVRFRGKTIGQTAKADVPGRISRVYVIVTREMGFCEFCPKPLNAKELIIVYHT